MPRKAIYTLITKSGPSREDQLAFIRQHVGIAKEDEVYTDDVSDGRRTRDARFHDRDNLMKQLRRGDQVVVATPGRLGIGRDDIRSVLHQLERKGAPLIDASTRRELVWTEQVADALHFFDRAMLEHKRDAAAAARGALKNMGITPVKHPKALSVPEDEARWMWLDEVRYPSGKAVAAACGVTQRTMYNRFGKRRLEPTPKKLTPSMKTPDGRNYLYVMSRRDGLHKIGFSLDPLNRMRQLGMQLKQQLRLVHFVLRPGDARALESLAHFYLRSKHRGGEWFEVDLDGAKKGIEMALSQLRVDDFQKRRRAIVEAAEKEAGRQFTRREINDLMQAMEVRDETEVE